MQLRVFADDGGGLRVEISNPLLRYKRHLFVPLVPASSPMLEGVDANALVEVLYAGNRFKVPYLLVHSEEVTLKNWREVGDIDENASRNILNHILDILAWD